MLAARKVQSIDQFLMSEPAIRRAVPDAKPVCLFAGDYGLDIYRQLDRRLRGVPRKNPDVVKKFVRAALRGWKDALSSPERRAACRSSTSRRSTRRSWSRRSRSSSASRSPTNVRKNGFGTVSPQRMKNNRRFHQQQHRVPGEKVTADQIYAPGYLPEKPCLP